MISSDPTSASRAAAARKKERAGFRDAFVSSRARRKAVRFPRRAHAEALLRSRGLWDAYGAAGWFRKGRRYGADAIFASNGARHKTTGRRVYGAAHYTPELLATVRRAYAMDYEMLDAIGYGGDAPVMGAPWAGVADRFTSCEIARDLCPVAAPEDPPPRARRSPAWVREIMEAAPS